MLKITHLVFRKLYLFIICPISHEKLTNSEIRESHYVPLFGLSTVILPQYTILVQI